MRAARVFTPQRGQRNHPANLAQRTQIKPIMPGQVEAAAAIGNASSEEFRLDCIDRGKAALDSGAIAHNANVVPHHVKKIFPQRVEIAGSMRKRIFGARYFKSEKVSI